MGKTYVCSVSIAVGCVAVRGEGTGLDDAAPSAQGRGPGGHRGPEEVLVRRADSGIQNVYCCLVCRYIAIGQSQSTLNTYNSNSKAQRSTCTNNRKILLLRSWPIIESSTMRSPSLTMPVEAQARHVVPVV